MKSKKTDMNRYRAVAILPVILALVTGSLTAAGMSDQANKEKLPEFELELLDEQTTLTTDSLNGQYTILYFWSVDCAICEREMPLMHDLYWQHEDQNLDIVSISVDKSVKAVQEFRERNYPMPWRNSVVGNELERLVPLVEQFDLDGFPVKILVSPEGDVLDITRGFSGARYKEKIKGILAAPA